MSDPAATAHWAEPADSCAGQLPSPGRLVFAHRARMWDPVVRGDIDSALHSARQAVEGFAPGEERVELCRTVLDAAEVAVGVRRTQEVVDWLDRAEALAGQYGSAQLADTVTRRRHELTDQPRSLAPEVPRALLSAGSGRSPTGSARA
ncbi:hypothetical protein [Streptomyces gilvus]|uniref:hypothetical protein n=1 Tax=Streptomyces gilvus TaxID=2920937 RepID=UPI001F0F4555|nr:hypothetical protein [Streptomyces sp. CME 23]MCH5670423.1 hypothetical protein [Streptomyces sp. CME 23]